MTDSVTQYHTLLVEEPESQRTSITGTSSTAYDSLTDGVESETAILTKVLNIALEDHARSIEHALQSCFDRRLTVKRQVRDMFETTFEAELSAIYPSREWRTESRAWIDPQATLDGEAEHMSSRNDLRGSRAGDESDTDTEVERRPSRRRSSLRKRLSFLSLRKG